MSIDIKRHVVEKHLFDRLLMETKKHGTEELPVQFYEGAFIGFEMYLVGSFNSWKVKDVIYKMTPVEGDPFKYTMTVPTFTSKTEVQYKYIMGSSTHYAWESYQNSPTANRTIYVPGGTSSVNDIVEVWQSLNLG